MPVEVLHARGSRMEQILISFCGQSTMQLSFIPVNFVSGWFPMVGEPTNSGMTENDMKALTGDIIRHLSAKKLKEAFTLVKKLVAETWLGEFSDKVYDLEETYSFIRKYTIEGVEDPEREKIYRHLVQSLIGLTSRIRENWLTTHSGSPFYLRKRSPDLLPLRNPRKFLEDLAHSQKVESPWNHGDTGETGGTPDLNDFGKKSLPPIRFLQNTGSRSRPSFMPFSLPMNRTKRPAYSSMPSSTTTRFHRKAKRCGSPP